MMMNDQLRARRFNPRKIRSFYETRGWVSSRIGVDALEDPRSCRVSNIDSSDAQGLR